MGDIDFTQEMRNKYYLHVHGTLNGKYEPRWRGVRIIKFPQDLILYAQVLWKRRPKFIIETGTAYGGSALFFADMLGLTGGFKVISIDTNPRNTPPHERITYIVGSSIDPYVIKKVKNTVGSYSAMAILDSNHRTDYVRQELKAYADIVTKDQYMVVEDCWTKHNKPWHPKKAVDEFLKERKDYKRYNLDKQFIFAVTRDGWLRKIR